jgi:hypothetical protein
MTSELTTPQLRELTLMSGEPQPTIGARTRVQHRLVERGLARYTDDTCEITEEGRVALARHRKACSGCHIPKDLNDFYRSATSADGRQSRCKVCERDRSKQRKHEKTGNGHPRKFGRFCTMCCGMPHRVKGDVCEECGTLAER